jgi:hypothetical protein
MRTLVCTKVENENISQFSSGPLLAASPFHPIYTNHHHMGNYCFLWCRSCFFTIRIGRNATHTKTAADWHKRSLAMCNKESHQILGRSTTNWGPIDCDSRLRLHTTQKNLHINRTLLPATLPNLSRKRVLMAWILTGSIRV